LADLLREEKIVAPAPAETIEDEPEDDGSLAAEIAAARDVRLFRAHVAEALESTVAMLRCDIAADVVGRELQLAPVSIAQIVRRALERCPSDRLLRVRVHPEDADALAAEEIETVADCGLRRGDAVLEVTGGAIDISLGVRLDSVLRAYR
jgi:flagellar biosynthesis/type III secretory pathway protein FliH